MGHGVERRGRATEPQPRRDSAQPPRTCLENILRAQAQNASPRQPFGEAKDAPVDVDPGREAQHGLALQRMLGHDPLPMRLHRALGRRGFAGEVDVARFGIGFGEARQRLVARRILRRFLDRKARAETRQQDVEHGFPRPIPPLGKPFPRRGQGLGLLPAEQILGQSAHQPRASMDDAPLDPEAGQARLHLPDGR